LSALESKIDDLYRLPLADFTTARNALAKTLSGADARRVKALAKPTVVPWAVNQVYWHARPVFDNVIRSGERLRAAQIASLEGKRADVRSAGDTHRESIAAAVKEAERLSKDTGSQPAADALMRTFEALSLAPSHDEPFGRLTKPMQPSGFEALAGVQVHEGARVLAHVPKRAAQPEHAPEKKDAKRERAEQEAARRHEAAVKAAEADLARVEAAEKKAREVWEHAHDELLEARKKLQEIKHRPT
jgi:hypothetical protein